MAPLFLLEYCMITLRICCLHLNLSFEVLSVICRLHNLRPPFKIPYYLVPLSRLGHMLSFIWRSYVACHGMSPCVNFSAVWTKYRLLTFDCDLGNRDQIVALCTSTHNGDYLGQVIYLKKKRFECYGADMKLSRTDRRRPFL